jgi:hypothetical protein
MAKSVGVADWPVKAVLWLFRILNPGKIRVRKDEDGNLAIFTAYPPIALRHPKGWYYEKGVFTNKHNTASGIYTMVLMLTESGCSWERYIG